MNQTIWLRLFFSFVGVGALALLIWFAGPLIPFAASRPLAGEGLRAASILGVFILVGAVEGLRLRRGAARRAGRFARRAGLAMVALTLALALLLMGLDYRRASEEIARTEEAAAAYKTNAEPAGADALRDHDFGGALKELDGLRALLAALDKSAAPWPSGGLGLSQTERLRSAAEIAYGGGLERLLRPRLARRLEQRLAAKAGDPADLFEPLKAYLMLGGRMSLDRTLLTRWIAREWAGISDPGPPARDMNKTLALHLAAMLDLDEGRGMVLLLNGALVEETQLALANIDAAARAYAVLAGAARSAGGDWTAREAGGPDGALIFTEGLDAVRIPYFLTMSGFEQAFIEKLPGVCDEMERDRLALGPAGEQPAVLARYDRLQDKIADLYAKAFVDAWRGELIRLRLRPLTSERPAYPLMKAAASPDSPIVRMLESVRDETLLPAGEAGVEADAVEPPAASDGAAPAARINAALSAFHRAVEGPPGRRPIDALTLRLSRIRDDLSRFVEEKAPRDLLRARIFAEARDLKRRAAALPAPFAGMFVAAAEGVEGELARAPAGRAR